MALRVQSPRPSAPSRLPGQPAAAVQSRGCDSREKLRYKGVLPEVLARVTSRAAAGPRGPDVLHRVKVPREWLTTGEVIELVLPRNLACAACGGGGCDTCGRSGAVTLRTRDEPAEIVEVSLPARPPEQIPDSRGITLRIPEQGGLPEHGSELPRGLLLLTVVPSDAPDENVRLLRGVASKRPARSAEDSDELSKAFLAREDKRPTPLVLVIVVVAVAAWVLLLIWLRLSRRG